MIPDSVYSASQQRRAEVLAAFASAPIGTTLSRFLLSVELSESTWYEWKHVPEFAAALEEIQRRRREVDLEPLEEALRDMTSALAKKARAGDVYAIRTAAELLGLLKPISQSVKVTTVLPTPGDGDAEGLIVERDGLRDLLVRRAQRLGALAADSGDPGPEGLGEGPPG